MPHSKGRLHCLSQTPYFPLPLLSNMFRRAMVCLPSCLSFGSHTPAINIIENTIFCTLFIEVIKEIWNKYPYVNLSTKPQLPLRSGKGACRGIFTRTLISTSVFLNRIFPWEHSKQKQTLPPGNKRCAYLYQIAHWLSISFYQKKKYIISSSAADGARCLCFKPMNTQNLMVFPNLQIKGIGSQSDGKC